MQLAQAPAGSMLGLRSSDSHASPVCPSCSSAERHQQPGNPCLQQQSARRNGRRRGQRARALPELLPALATLHTEPQNALSLPTW